MLYYIISYYIIYPAYQLLNPLTNFLTRLTTSQLESLRQRLQCRAITHLGLAALLVKKSASGLRSW